MQWFHRRSTKCGRGRGRGRRRRTNSARISHPPPFRRVTKNEFHTVELIFNFVYSFESARIECVYAITHM